MPKREFDYLLSPRGGLRATGRHRADGSRAPKAALGRLSMKFEAPKAVLLDALQMAVSAIPNKTTLQILYNLLLKLEGGQLEIRATDLDMTIVLRLTVEGHEDGEIVINARKLLEVVKELPDFPVLLSVDDYMVTIKSESGFQCNLTGFDAGEYPALPDLGQAQAFQVPLKELRFLYEKTGFAVSGDFSRMALTGVYGEFKQGNLQMVATDGHRLGKAWTALKGLPEQPGVILPPKALSQVLHMSEDPEYLINVEIGPANARFSTESISITSKLIEGPYPNYENVIPKDFSKKMKANRELLGSVIRRVATMANAKTRLVVFGFGDRTLTLSAKNQDLGGDSEEGVPVEYAGEPAEVGINAQYLQEVFRLIHTEEVQFRFNNPLGAIIVEPVMENPSYFFIVMPLRILKDAQ
ncbi:MAG TPA: DNA polymerase III subunit beta [Fibrobacteria bacterium]|nr:DNA polymerase III subunit beta [Fibrobacteria bacterium]